MTKRVQILGHDFETANAFLGEEREITVDTDNWALRLHDGETPGGWLIYNRDQNDARYQARSVELDGLLGWEPNERGLVTRLGPANYALCEILERPRTSESPTATAIRGRPKSRCWKKSPAITFRRRRRVHSALGWLGRIRGEPSRQCCGESYG